MVSSCWLFLYDLCYDALIHEHQAKNTHSATTMVARKRLIVTLYINCVSFDFPPLSPRIRNSLPRSIPYKFKSVVEQAKIQNTHFVIPLSYITAIGQFLCHSNVSAKGTAQRSVSTGGN